MAVTHVLARDLAQHGFLAAIGFGAERGALQHLAQVVGVVGGEAVVQRRRGKERGVGTAPADDDVGPHLEQAPVGVHAGHGDDARGRIELGLGQVGEALEPAHARAVTQALAHPLGAHLRVEPPEPERRQAVLRGQLPDDPAVQVHPAVRARVPGRADDHRHPQPARSQQHLLEVVALPAFRAAGGVGAQRHRADVVAAGVGGDDVRAGVDAELEARRTQGRETEVSVRADDLQGMHVGTGGSKAAGRSGRTC
jgi:hypothetical protein